MPVNEKRHDILSDEYNLPTENFIEGSSNIEIINNLTPLPQESINDIEDLDTEINKNKKLKEDNVLIEDVLFNVKVDPKVFTKPIPDSIDLPDNLDYVPNPEEIALEFLKTISKDSPIEKYFTNEQLKGLVESSIPIYNRLLNTFKNNRPQLKGARDKCKKDSSEFIDSVNSIVTTDEETNTTYQSNIDKPKPPKLVLVTAFLAVLNRLLCIGVTNAFREYYKHIPSNYRVFVAYFYLQSAARLGRPEAVIDVGFSEVASKLKNFSDNVIDICLSTLDNFNFITNNVTRQQIELFDQALENIDPEWKNDIGYNLVTGKYFLVTNGASPTKEQLYGEYLDQIQFSKSEPLRKKVTDTNNNIDKRSNTIDQPKNPLPSSNTYQFNVSPPLYKIQKVFDENIVKTKPNNKIDIPTIENVKKDLVKKEDEIIKEKEILDKPIVPNQNSAINIIKIPKLPIYNKVEEDYKYLTPSIGNKWKINKPKEQEDKQKIEDKVFFYPKLSKPYKFDNSIPILYSSPTTNKRALETTKPLAARCYPPLSGLEHLLNFKIKNETKFILDPTKGEEITDTLRAKIKLNYFERKPLFHEENIETLDKISKVTKEAWEVWGGSITR